MLKFIIDFEKDAWNWWRIFSPKKPLYSLGKLTEKDKEFAGTLKNTSFEEAYSKLRDFLYQKYLIETRLDAFMIAVSKEWEKIENEYILTLEKITKREFPFKKDAITVYATTAFLNPYNVSERWMMLFPMRKIEQAKTLIAHELLHFQFHYYFERQLIGSGVLPKNFHLIKESLTFLLNEPEFQNILPFSDKCYTQAQEKMQASLKDFWNKNKNFDLLVEETVREANK